MFCTGHYTEMPCSRCTLFPTFSETNDGVQSLVFMFVYYPERLILTARIHMKINLVVQEKLSYFLRSRESNLELQRGKRILYHGAKVYPTTSCPVKCLSLMFWSYFHTFSFTSDTYIRVFSLNSFTENESQRIRTPSWSKKADLFQ